MKKTIKVSLGGFAYNLDDDAFLLLDSYINDLKSRLRNEKDGSEIVKDIEERIAELFSEKKGNADSISIEIVKEVIETLGKPEDITSDTGDSTQTKFSTSTPRRLYRNTEHTYIAGVCSGLGEYFRTDPIVIRILFLLLVFAKGFGIILYLVLWIAVPKAKTPKQKLEMKGEPINISNIEKSIREEQAQVKESYKKHGLAGFIENLVRFIGRLAYWFIQFLLVIIKAIAVIIAVILIVTMLIALFAVFNVVFFGGILFNSFFPEIHGIPLGEVITSMFEFSTSIWVTIPIFLIIAIPIFVLLYLGVRILFRFKARDGIIGLIAAGIWIFSIVAIAFVVFYQAKSFTIRSHVTETIVLSPNISKGGTLYIKSTEKPDSLNYLFSNTIDIDDYSIEKIDGKTVITGKPELIIEKCDKEYPVIELIRNARGGTTVAAEINAKNIKYQYVLKDSVLNLDSYFTIPSGEKWKLQELSIVLHVPENYKLYFDSSLEDIMNPRQPKYKYWPNEITNKKWRMKENTLKALEKDSVN